MRFEGLIGVIVLIGYIAGVFLLVVTLFSLGILAIVVIVTGIPSSISELISKINFEVVVEKQRWNERDSIHSEVPHEVLLFQDYTFYAFCKGTILNEYSVLTSAHCFDNVDLFADIEVVAGGNTLKWYYANLQTRIATRKNIHIHYDYKKTQNGIWLNDLAIIRVQEPFYLNHCVAPVSLPRKDLPYPSGEVKVPGIPSRDGKTLLLSQTDCGRRVGKLKRWSEIVLCTKGPKGNHITKEDTGGPLTQGGVLTGVLSGCKEDQCFFTRVSEHLGWIQLYTKPQDKDEL